MVASTDRLLFANNRTAHLATNLAAGDTALTLAAGESTGWPEPAGGEYFVLTIQNLLTGAFEICHGIGRLGDTITLTRGQEGTTAGDFTVDMSIVQMRVTKGVLEKLIQQNFTAADAEKYLQVDATGAVVAVDLELPEGPQVPVTAGFVGAAVTRTLDLAVPADTAVPFDFNVQLYDTHFIWEGAPGYAANRFYAPADGYYFLLVTAHWSSDPAAIGRRCIFINKNSSSASAESGRVAMNETKDQSQQVVAHAYLNAGEFFDVSVLATNATTMKCSVQNAHASFFSTVGAKGDKGDEGDPGPAGTPPGGVAGDVQFNDGGVFGGSSAFTFNKATGVVNFTNPPTVAGGPVGGGGGTPGGATTQIQFNDAGAFAGDAGFTFDKATKAVTLGGATVTANAPVLNLTQTWNAGAVTFQGVKLNVTDTASATFSLLLDLQVGGASKFAVRKDGSINLPMGTKSSTSIGFNGVSNYGIYLESTGSVAIAFNGEVVVHNYNDRIVLPTENSLAWSSANRSTCTGTSTTDIRLNRDGAGILAQRNGTTAQTYRVYNTFTDASNYERTSLGWSANVAYLRNENLGTGIARLFIPVTGATTVASLPSAATAGIGARSFVTDATATTFLSTVAGGGSNKVPVVSDGTNWLIG